MKLLTQEMFDRHWPDGDDAMIDGILSQQQTAFAAVEINSDLRLAHFMGQITVECEEGKVFTEGLSYSTPARLMKIYESHFPTLESALPYVRNPAKLANFVYGNRLGNRGTDSGDGYLYRGRGYIQLTGRDNYRKMGLITGLDLLAHPELALDPKHALEVTCAFWKDKNANAVADRNSVIAMTKCVNGGVNGLHDRIAATAAWKAELGVS